MVPPREVPSPADLPILVDRLLDVSRPRAAFNGARLRIQSLDTPRLKRLLRQVATVNSEPAAAQCSPDPFYIAKALNALESRPEVTCDEMAGLELRYLDVLLDSEADHGIRNLENWIAASPEAFALLVALCSPREDGGQDPPGWSIAELGGRHAVVANLLRSRIHTIPGTGPDGQIDSQALVRWLSGARRLCRKHARLEAGDWYMGTLLAKAPAGPGGRWPCQSVCDAIEAVASSSLCLGFVRGCTSAAPQSHGHLWIDEVGRKHRAEASRYEAWANARRFDYPLVGVLLDRIAKHYRDFAQPWDSEAELVDRLRH